MLILLRPSEIWRPVRARLVDPTRYNSSVGVYCRTHCPKYVAGVSFLQPKEQRVSECDCHNCLILPIFQTPAAVQEDREKRQQMERLWAKMPPSYRKGGCIAGPDARAPHDCAGRKIVGSSLHFLLYCAAIQQKTKLGRVDPLNLWTAMRLGGWRGLEPTKRILRGWYANVTLCFLA